MGLSDVLRPLQEEIKIETVARQLIDAPQANMLLALWLIVSTPIAGLVGASGPLQACGNGCKCSIQVCLRLSLRYLYRSAFSKVSLTCKIVILGVAHLHVARKTCRSKP